MMFRLFPLHCFKLSSLTDWHYKFEWSFQRSPSLSSWPLLCGHTHNSLSLSTLHSFSDTTIWMDPFHDYSFFTTRLPGGGIFTSSIEKAARVRLVIEVYKEQKKIHLIHLLTLCDSDCLLVTQSYYCRSPNDDSQSLTKSTDSFILTTKINANVCLLFVLEHYFVWVSNRRNLSLKGKKEQDSTLSRI